MSNSAIYDQISEDIKSAMRAKDKEKLATLRFLAAALKQKEVDERIELSDADVIAVIEKSCKQRKDAIDQYTAGGREELAQAEAAELAVLQTYLPPQLSEDELTQLIQASIAEVQATEMKDMGKVMATLKPKVQGRADMGQLSAKIKALLS